MKQQIKRNDDGRTPREQRFFESSRGIKDPKSGKRYYCTSDRSLAVFLVNRNHAAGHVWIAGEAYCAFPLTAGLQQSIVAASREDGADLFQVIDKGIAIFTELLANEAIHYYGGFSGRDDIDDGWQMES